MKERATMRGIMNRVLAAAAAVVIAAGSLGIPVSAAGRYFRLSTQLVEISKGESVTITAKCGEYPAVYVVGNTSKDTVVGVNETRQGHYDLTFYCGADEAASGYTVYLYKGVSTGRYDAVNVHVKENQTPPAVTTANATSAGKSSGSFAGTYAGFNQSVAAEVRSCAADGTVTIEAGEYVSLYRTAISAIAERPDVTLIIRFRYDNTDLQLEIPAGAHIESRIDNNGCIGLAGLYGDYAAEYTR